MKATALSVTGMNNQNGSKSIDSTTPQNWKPSPIKKSNRNYDDGNGFSNYWKIKDTLEASHCFYEKQHEQRSYKYAWVVSRHRELLCENHPSMDAIEKSVILLKEAFTNFTISADALEYSRLCILNSVQILHRSQHVVPDFEAPMMSSRDAASYLGVDRKSMVRIARENNIRGMKFDGFKSNYFFTEDLDRYIYHGAADKNLGRRSR